MRKLNLVSDEDDGWAERERRERNAREQAVLDKLAASGYVPPPVYEWDIEDRAWELEAGRKMVDFSRRTTSLTHDTVVVADLASLKLSLIADRRNIATTEVLAGEEAVTVEAQANLKAYAAEFKVNAAGVLVDALCKVHTEVKFLIMREIARTAFRSMRIPMQQSRSKSMFNRKKMVNWIRICLRLKAIDRRALQHHRTRNKWVFFNRWIKVMVIFCLFYTSFSSSSYLCIYCGGTNKLLVLMVSSPLPSTLSPCSIWPQRHTTRHQDLCGV
jgi:hypothetical protein